MIRNPARRRGMVVLAVLAVGALFVAAQCDHPYVAQPRLTAMRMVDSLQPDVAWETAPPEEHGLDPSCLDDLQRELANRGTSSLLVARDGRLVFEWYARGVLVDDRHYSAALTKALAGGFALLLSVDDGRVRLEDPVSRYLPAWRADPDKASVTLAQLATHSSGLEDVRFSEEQQGWKETYRKDSTSRFELATSRAELVDPPGRRYRYSGMGYYVLAYALAAQLEGTPYRDLRHLLEVRLMEPLGIDRDAWDVSYGESYRFDGRTQVAVGSGGGYTPRAVARIGQLVVDEGRFEGRSLVSPESIASLLQVRSPLPPAEPPSGPGWWLNAAGYWSSLPRDALVGAGGGHQLLLVVPSEKLVVARMGSELEPSTVWGPDYWQTAGEHLFDPVMACVEGRQSAARATTRASSR